MQTIQTQSNGSTIPTTAAKASGISQDTDGVIRIRLGNSVRAECVGAFRAVRHQMLSHECLIDWVEWDFDSLNWNHLASLLRLEGASIQQLVGENIFLLRGEHRPAYSSVPGIKKPKFAEIWSVPEGTSAREAAQMIAQIFRA